MKLLKRKFNIYWHKSNFWKENIIQHWLQNSSYVKCLSSTVRVIHVTSKQPCWCPKLKQWPHWCPKVILSEFNSFLREIHSCFPINLHGCWLHDPNNSICMILPRLISWWVVSLKITISRKNTELQMALNIVYSIKALKKNKSLCESHN